MKKLLWMGASALYVGMSAHAALAAQTVRTARPRTVSVATDAAYKPLAEPVNFDASMSPAVKQRRRQTTRYRLTAPDTISGDLRIQRLTPAGMLDTHVDKTLHKPTFIWAGKKAQELNFVVFRQGKGASIYGRTYLKQFSSQLQISAAAVDHARLVFLHDDGTGPVIARYQQVVDGYDVVGRQLNVVMNQDLRLVAISGYFANDKGFTESPDTLTGKFSTGPQAAMNAAFNDLGLPVSAYQLQRTSDRTGGFTSFAQPKFAQQTAAVRLTAPVGARKVLFPVGGNLVPGWLMTVQASRADSRDGIGYAYVATADGSTVLYRKNLVDRASYEYRVFADAVTGKPDDNPLGNDLMPYPGTYTETFGSGALVTVASGTQGVADAWLPIPVAGAPTDETTGNNVWAYADVAGGDGQDDPADISATTTSAGKFDYTINFSNAPSDATNQEAAIVNLFYIDNWLHDAWYNAGFTEAVGNAQYTNYGRGGVEMDPILAEAQDFSGRNNSNMYTPPDGYSPIQQMYLFDGPVASQTATATDTVTATDYAFDPAVPAAFGPKEYSSIIANLVVYDDGTGTTDDACEAPTAANATALSGQIAFVIRGTCAFADKVANAEAAGAIGVVVANNVDGDDAIIMGGDGSTITIPSIMISSDDATPVMAAIAAGDSVTMEMALDMAPDRDGALATQVVAHEFFHYVSNRLVGDALGLSNVQGGGMGEGWSDMAALLLTARPDDLANNPDGKYTIGGYVTDNFVYGIRAEIGVPYTTDMSVNSVTFNVITMFPEVHGVGTVWATMLWEAYVGLYKHYDAIDSTTAYEVAKTKMMNYIIEGLMATPNAPTMIEARDAILAAAKATSDDDYNVFVTAFAKRGMGFGAIAPPRNSTDLTGVQENYSADTKSFVIQDASLDVNAAGVCDADYSLDPGEVGQIKITLLNTGSADLNGVTAHLKSKDDLTFSNDGEVTFETLSMLGGTATATATAKVNSATEQGQFMTVDVDFPDVGDLPDAVQEAKSFQLQFTSNQDYKPTKTSDDVEDTFADLSDFTRTLTGDGVGWSIDSQFDGGLGLPSDNQYWYGPDNASPNDSALVTPPITVGSDPFSVTFTHYYEFESSGGTNWDGGVVEISTDGGATWTDVTKAGGTFAYGYNGTIGPDNPYLAGRAGFVDFGYAGLGGTAPETLSFGTTLAGKTVQLRFRIGSDLYSGQVGWIIDDISVTGAAQPMFSTVAPEDSYCHSAPVANAGADQTIAAGTKVTLDGSASSDAEGGVTYQWKQTAGDSVKLSDTSAAAPSFTAPFGAAKYSFQLTVTDGIGQTATDSVTVAVTDTAPTANAGNDVSVQGGAAVKLDGSGSSDAEGPITYQWEQTAGNTVTLSGATSAKPGFTAPNGTGSLTFKLTVTDKSGQTDTDSVTVQTQEKVESPVQKGGGGGVAGLLMLLGLFGLGFMRRRRN